MLVERRNIAKKMDEKVNEWKGEVAPSVFVIIPTF